MCDWLLMLAVVLNSVSAWILWREKQSWRQLKAQYRAYVETLEAVVAHLKGREE